MRNYAFAPFLLFGIFLFLAFFPVVIFKSNFEVLEHNILQGQRFEYMANYCKLLPLPARVQIAYAGELYYPAPETYATKAKWGCNKATFSFTAPANLPPGTYHLEVFVSYPPFLRTFTKESTEFNIIQDRNLQDKVSDIWSIINGWEEEK